MARYEEAFAKIKAATGVEDPDRIYQKFLSGDASIESLTFQVKDHERRIVELKAEEERLAKELNGLQFGQSVVSSRALRQVDDASFKAENRLNQCQEKHKSSLAILQQANAGILHLSQVLHLSHSGSEAYLSNLFHPTADPDEEAGKLLGMLHRCEERVLFMLEKLQHEGYDMVDFSQPEPRQQPDGIHVHIHHHGSMDMRPSPAAAAAASSPSHARRNTAIGRLSVAIPRPGEALHPGPGGVSTPGTTGSAGMMPSPLLSPTHASPHGGEPLSPGMRRKRGRRRSSAMFAAYKPSVLVKCKMEATMEEDVPESEVVDEEETVGMQADMRRELKLRSQETTLKQNRSMKRASSGKASKMRRRTSTRRNLGRPSSRG